MISLVLSAVLLLAVLAGCSEAESSSKGGRFPALFRREDTSLKGSTLNLFTWEGHVPRSDWWGLPEERRPKSN